MIILWLALASTIVDGPCGALDKAVAKDAVAADDAVLREAASLAEDAGDHLLATRLLIRLRDRTRDEGVRAEAQDALSSIKNTKPPIVCEASSRSVIVQMHEAAFLSAPERSRLETFALAELRSRDLEATLDSTPSIVACGLDERCLRRELQSASKGAIVRLTPVRVGPVVSLGVVVTGFKGRAEHELELDGDSARWSPVLTNPALDDVVELLPAASARSTRRDVERPQSGGGDAVIAGIAISGVGLAVAGVGAAMLIEPRLFGAERLVERKQVQAIGIGTVVAGGAVVVGGIIAVALIVDARNNS